MIYEQTNWLSIFNNSFHQVVSAIDKYYDYKDLAEKSKIQNVFAEQKGDLVNQIFPNSQFEGNIFEVMGQEVKKAFADGGIDSARAVLDGSKAKLRIVSDGLSANLTKQSALKFNSVINDAMNAVDHGFNQMVSLFNTKEALKENTNLFSNGFRDAVDANTQKQWMDFANEKGISKAEIKRAVKNKYVNAVLQNDRESLKSLADLTNNQEILSNGLKAIDATERRQETANLLENKSKVTALTKSFYSNPTSSEFQQVNSLLNSVVSKDDRQSGLDVIFGNDGGNQIDFGDVSVDSLKDWSTVGGLAYNKKAFQEAVNRLDSDDYSDEAMALRMTNSLVHSFIRPDDVTRFLNNVSSPKPEYQVQSDPKFQTSKGDFDENLVNQALAKNPDIDTSYKDIVKRCMSQFGFEGLKMSDAVVQACLNDELKSYGINPVDVAIGKVVNSTINEGNHIIKNSDGSSNIVNRGMMQSMIDDGKKFVESFIGSKAQRENLTSSAKSAISKISPEEIISGDGKKYSISREFLDGYIPNGVNSGNVGFFGNYKKIVLASSLNHIKLPNGNPEAEIRMINLLKNPDRDGVEITRDKLGNPEIQVDGKSLAEYLYPDNFKIKAKIGKKQPSSSTNEKQEYKADIGADGFKNLQSRKIK